jgi:hypothetical protein
MKLVQWVVLVVVVNKLPIIAVIVELSMTLCTQTVMCLL